MLRRLGFPLLLVGLSLLALSLPLAQAQTVDAGRRSRPVVTRAVDDNDLAPLRGHTRPEANRDNDRGGVGDRFPMSHMLLQLRRPADEERALQQFLDEVQNPASPNYHKWLTPEQFGQNFGVAQQDLDAVTRWLRSHEFIVNSIYPNRMMIDFSGTAGDVRKAFHTEIHNLDVKGVRHIANMRDPQIPAALAPVIVGVVSLHDFKPHALHQMRKPRANYTFGSLFGDTFAVVPTDLATIYNLKPLFQAGITGQGQTIALIEDTNVFRTSDWKTFRTKFGLSGYTSATFSMVHPAPLNGPNNCANPGVIAPNDAEAILDAEWASAAAPSATILMASCADTTTTFGGLIALQNLINGSGQPPALVSISYGQCEAENGAPANAAYNSTYQQAVAEGVSIFVAAGDSGAAGCDNSVSQATHGIGVNAFASTPYNVAVGGTDFSDTYSGTNSLYWSSTNTSTLGSALSYIPEIPWNDSCAGVLLSNYVSGSGITYGADGFCSSQFGSFFQNTVAGGGGPSACATGSPSAMGVVGGTCQGWPKPSWQSALSNLGNPNDGVRDTPDVSLFAADGLWNHYYAFCWSDTANGGAACSGAPRNWSGAGGTSFASPIMAGIQALINQKTGQRQGNPNPVYYQLAASEYNLGNSSCNSANGNTVAGTCIFYDVTQGDMDVNCTGSNNCYLSNGTDGVLSTQDNTYNPSYGTGAGWDFASGIGSINAANLANNWPSSTPNYTLSSSPHSVSEVQGATVTSAITISAQNGFSGGVTLAASGLPTGVTATFSPNPATSSSTLTLMASSTASTGTAAITITGTSGSLTNTTGISLTVIPPGNYLLSALPGSVSVTQGASNTTAISVAAQNGFSGAVSLAASGLPTGVTALFSPNPATSSSTLTLMASTTANTGTATVTITGMSGSLTNTTTVGLTVTARPDFALSALPSSVSMAQGASNTSAVSVTAQNGFSGGVTLAASGLPTGVTATFSPNPATSSSTLTLTASSTATIGNATVTITGTSGSLTHTTTVALTVSAGPNFTLSASPISVSVAQGASNTSAISVTAQNGFSNTVTLAASGLPSGVTATFSPNPASSTSTLTLTASSTANMGTAVPVTITGTSGSLTNTTGINVAVTGPQNFALSAPSSVSMTQGASSTTAISVTGQNGFNGNVSLAASGLPNGVTAAFTPNPASSSSILILTASSTASTGTVTVTITGTSGSLINTTTFTLNLMAATTPTSGWHDGDVGSVGLAGTATFTNGTFTVTGAGAQIFGTADSFNFVYQVLPGDGSIVARVASVNPTTATPGIMIRDSLDPGAMSAFGAYFNSNAYLNYRTTTGGGSLQASSPAGSLPYWLKVSRTGSSVSAYTSPDGINWVQIGGSQTISMGQNVYVGLVMCSNSASTLATATFDNVSVNSTTVPAPVISNLSATTGWIGSQVGISGSGFGPSQGGSVVLLNGTQATINSWSDTFIGITVPAGATSGPLAVLVAPNMNASNPVQFTVTAQPLPSAWLNQDIGPASIVGSASYANGTFTVKAAGAQVFGTADDFNFTYQALSGDGSIVARVASVNPSSATTGVMIRGSLDPSAMSAFGAYFNSNAYLNYRTTAGGSSSQASTPAGSLPYWMKVSRSGSTVSAYTSLDGVNWAQIGGGLTISMGQNIYVGLVMCSNNASTLATATFDNVSVNSAAVPAPSISNVSATTGSTGNQVAISGSGFGASQGNSIVSLNGAEATINSWSDTSVGISVPSGATSGPLAVLVTPGMNASNPVEFTVTSQPLPTPWLDQEVGLVGIRGSATYANGTFTVTGAGSQIFGTADSFHFAYQVLSGDGTIVARVASVNPSTATPGIMIRDSLNPGAMSAFGAYFASNAYLNYRTTTGGGSLQASSPAGNLPYWLKVSRTGSTVSAYTSSDGVSWVQIGSGVTINMGQNVYVGLVMCSNNASTLATATFDNVTVTAP